MAIPSGLAGQLGFAQETTYGTEVTVTRFVPMVDESLETVPTQLESAGVIASQLVLRTQQWSQGMKLSSGDVGLELYDRSVGLLFKHALGSVTTSGTQAPFTHTFTPSDLTSLGLTIQVGRPDRGGTVRPFTYAGCKIATWEVAVAAGEIATLGLGITAKSEVTSTSLASASYTSGIAPMTFVGGSVSLAGSSLCVRSARIAGDNKLKTDRMCIGQQTIDEPLAEDLREYTGELEIEFPDLVHYNRFMAGTEGALSLVIAKGTSTATFAANIRTDAFNPKVAGRGILVQPLSFKCVGTNSDASALTVTLVNSDTNP